MKKPQVTPLAPLGEVDDSGWSPLPAADAPEAPAADARWPARALAVRAKPFDAEHGAALFSQLWKHGGHGLPLAPDDMAGLAGYLVYAEVPAGAEVIRQDERGEFLIVLLDGRVLVEQSPIHGERTRLAEAGAGDLLGEMSLLDAGTRSSSCTTRSACVVAVLEADRLADMMQRDPRLAVALLSTLARRLSLRLRQATARLSVLLSGS